MTDQQSVEVEAALTWFAQVGWTDYSPARKHANVLARRIETLQEQIRQRDEHEHDYDKEIDMLTRERDEWKHEAESRGEWEQNGPEYLDRAEAAESQVETLTEERDHFEREANLLVAERNDFMDQRDEYKREADDKHNDLGIANARLNIAVTAVEQIQKANGELPDPESYEAIEGICRDTLKRIGRQ